MEHTILIHRLRRFFCVICGLFVFALLAVDVKASSLFGRVVEVNSGDVITIFNLNRPVRIRLLGVDAPEMNQPFGDVAKKHLSDLVYDKSVLVEYSGISADSSLSGRVLLDSRDVGAQMIRDGAAWFDLNNFNRLSATDREVYQQSEQAARNERRGLWQAENPIAPWEFVKNETLRRNPVPSSNSVLPAPKEKSNRPTSELTNLSLLTRGASAAAPAPALSGGIDPNLAWAMPSEVRKNWRQLRPDGEDFSALVPEEGRQVKQPAPFGNQMVDVNIYMARDGMAIYAVMWITAPTYGETDKSAINGTLQGFLTGVGAGFDAGAQRSGFTCEPQGEKNISPPGYTGKEFDLPSCTVPARVRTFTRVVGDKRQMYFGAVFYMEEDENVTRFLNSFTVNLSKKTKARRR